MSKAIIFHNVDVIWQNKAAATNTHIYLIPHAEGTKAIYNDNHTHLNRCALDKRKKKSLKQKLS